MTDLNDLALQIHALRTELTEATRATRLTNSTIDSAEGGTSLDLTDIASTAGDVETNMPGLQDMLDTADDAVASASTAVTEAIVAANQASLDGIAAGDLANATADLAQAAADEAVENAQIALDNADAANAAAIDAKAAGDQAKIDAAAAVEAAQNAMDLVAGDISADRIVAGSITGDKLVGSTITGDKIAANTLTAANIQAGSITGATIAADTLTSREIAADAISANELAANAVIARNILAGTITGSHIAANTIAAGNIVANTITGDKIAAGTITTANLQAGAITADKLDANAINGKTITGVTVRTAASGSRVEVINNRLDFYNASNQNTGQLKAGINGGLTLFNPYTSTDVYNPAQSIRFESDAIWISNTNKSSGASQYSLMVLRNNANGIDHLSLSSSPDSTLNDFGEIRIGYPDTSGFVTPNYAGKASWDLWALDGYLSNLKATTANVNVLTARDATVENKLTVKSPYSSDPTWTTTINTDYTGITSPDFRLPSGVSIVPTDTGWRPITATAGLTSSALAYRIVGDVVYFRGQITRTAGQFPDGYTSLFSLPPAAPAVYTRIPVGQYKGYTALLVIDVNGGVSVGSNAVSDAIYLNGVSYLRT